MKLLMYKLYRHRLQLSVFYPTSFKISHFLFSIFLPILCSNITRHTHTTVFVNLNSPFEPFLVNLNTWNARTSRLKILFLEFTVPPRVIFFRGGGGRNHPPIPPKHFLARRRRKFFGEKHPQKTKKDCERLWRLVPKLTKKTY